ncbi:MAG: hypothetical protein ACO1OC_13015 [Tuberibacillus sp.]
MPDEHGINFSNPNYIKLADGTKANLTLNKNASILHWFDKSSHIDYSIMIMVSEGENPYGKQDLLKIANSMR